MTRLTARELGRTNRDLRASLALARPDSPTRVPILARMRARIGTRLARRAVTADRPILPAAPR